MWTTIWEKGVRGKFWRMLLTLYRKTSAAIKMGGLRSDEFMTAQGVKQGCALSSTLYTMYMEILITKLEETKLGVTLTEDRKIPALLYADDVLLMADNRADFKKLIKTYETFCADYRASTNADKTEHIIFMKRERDMSKMKLCDLSSDDSDDEVSRTQSKIKARKYMRLRTKMTFNRKEVRVIQDHTPISSSEITAYAGEIMKAATKKNNKWATVMRNGKIGLFPEHKLNRTYLTRNTQLTWTNEEQIPFEDEDALISVHHPIKLLGDQIKRARVITVVGNILAWDLSDAPNRQHRYQKATKAWAKVSHALNQSRYFSMELWLTSWRAKVLTHLRYCEGVNKGTRWDKGGSLVNKHLRWILGHQDKSAIAAIHDELKTLPLNELRALSMIKLWGKIIQLPKDNVLRLLFEQDKEEITKSYWAKYVKAILVKMDLEEQWNTSTIPTDNRTKNWKKLMKRLHRNTWLKTKRIALKDNKLLGEFRLIRNKLRTKRLKYMSSMDRTGARILTRLRSGSSDLEVSLGRRPHTPVPYENRWCKHCKGNGMDKVETLKHFLLICPHFTDERKDLLDRNGWARLSTSQQFRVMTGNIIEDTEITALLTYIRRTYAKRHRERTGKSCNELWWIGRGIN